MLFLSFSVKLEMENRFSGSAGDPTFLEVMTPGPKFDPWNDYLDAFSAAA